MSVPPVVQYDADNHVYYADGVRVPSVTQILVEANLIDTRHFTDEARDRGAAVAAYTSLDDEGELNEDHDNVRQHMGYILAWRKFRAETADLEIIENEKAYYHVTYRYAGTVDRVVMIRGRLCIIDLKTGGIYPSYAWQTAGYAEFVGCNLSTGQARVDRMCVALRENGTYKPEFHKKSSDWNVFVSALTLWHTRNENGLLQKEIAA